MIVYHTEKYRYMKVVEALNMSVIDLSFTIICKSIIKIVHFPRLLRPPGEITVQRCLGTSYRQQAGLLQWSNKSFLHRVSATRK